MATATAALLAEFVGTFMLVFTVGCNILSHSPAVWASASIACTLMAMTYCFHGVSGGHLNPAVTLAAGLANKFGGNFSGWPMAFAYMTVQFAGGIAGGFCNRALFEDKVGLGPALRFSWWEVMIVEVLYTAMLAFVVLSVATSKRNNPEENPNQFYALAIGFVLVAGGYAVAPITGLAGAVFNPAVALGVVVSSFGWVQWGFTYISCQAIGSVVAALLFRLTRPEDCMDEAGFLAYEPKLATKLAGEFLGTFMLVLTFGLNVLARSPAAAWSAAASAMCMMYAVADVSGGYFNPAVTLAVVLSRKGDCTPRAGVAYAIVQVIAGLLAGLLYAGLYQSQTIALEPKLPYGDKAAYIIEFIFTLVLSYVVLATACVKGITSPLSRNHYFALAVGMALTAGGCAGGAVSGGVLNPAVSFGIAVPNTLNRGELFYCMTYSLIQLFGGLVASLVFHLTHAAEYSAKLDRPLFAQEH